MMWPKTPDSTRLQCGGLAAERDAGPGYAAARHCLGRRQATPKRTLYGYPVRCAATRHPQYRSRQDSRV